MTQGLQLIKQQIIFTVNYILQESEKLQEWEVAGIWEVETT